MAPADYRTVCQYRLPCLSRLLLECNYPGIIERENQRIAAQRQHLPAAEAQFNATVFRHRFYIRHNNGVVLSESDRCDPIGCKPLSNQ